MNREPPAEVRRILRREVGFGCPYPGCGNPYLYWHHFDPTWSEREHHDPAGMIALCGEHHPKADAGTFTKEQLRRFKRDGANRSEEVKARFDWMRNRLLAVVGGNFFFDTPVVFRFNGEPSIWFTRDTDDYLMLNVRMLTASGQPRVKMEDNWWLVRGDPEDVESPPSGKLLRIRYANGDDLRVEFVEMLTVNTFDARYPKHPDLNRSRSPIDAREPRITFPITVVEVQMIVGETPIQFGPHHTSLPGGQITGSLMVGCGTAINLDLRPREARTE